MESTSGVAQRGGNRIAFRVSSAGEGANLAAGVLVCPIPSPCRGPGLHRIGPRMPKVVDQVPILPPENEHNARYLATKREKLGHQLPPK